MFTLLTWSSFSSSQDKISKNQKEDSANTCNVFAPHFEFLSFNIISCQMLFESFRTSNFLEKHYVFIESWWYLLFNRQQESNSYYFRSSTLLNVFFNLFSILDIVRNRSFKKMIGKKIVFSKQIDIECVKKGNVSFLRKTIS